MDCPARAARFATRTVPDVGALKPAISRNAVDFPQPEGPSSDTNSLLRTSRSIGPNATTPMSYVLVTPRRLTATPAPGLASMPDKAGAGPATLVLRPQIETDA